MSTGKRIVSTLLAVTMVLTLIPSSIFAIDENATVTTAGNRIGEGPDWIADTSSTTEVIRLGSASYQYGNQIVPATPSGIPKSEGKWGQSAYGGETPEIPTVYLELSGNAAFFKEGVLMVGGAGGSGNPSAYILNDNGTKENISLTFTPADTNEGSGYSSFVKDGETWTTRRWTWQISGSIGDTNLSAMHKNVMFTIPYSVNGKMYEATAYSHVEKILRPNGSVLNDFYMMDYTAAFNKYDRNVNISDLTMIIGENTYSGWYSGSPESGTWGYINYNATSINGASLDSDGFSSNVSDMGVADNTYGTVYSWRADHKNSMTQNDGNGFNNDSSGNNIHKRTLTTIYVDTGYDHLGTGTYNGKTNGLNLRLTLQCIEDNNTYYQFFNQVAIMDGFDTTYTDKYPPASVGNGTVRINQQDCYWKENGTYTPFAQLDKLYGKTTDVSTGRTITCGLSGDATGITSGADYCLRVEVKTTPNLTDIATPDGLKDFKKKSGDAYPEIESYPVYDPDNGWVTSSFDCYAYATNYYSLKFIKYDTTTLRTLFEGITKGYINGDFNATQYDGVTFKISNPEPYYFGLSKTSQTWIDFENAYNAAGAILVTPDINSQDTITNAYNALKNAYNALGNVQNYTITVDHLLEDGTPITTSQVYKYISTDPSVAKIYTEAEVAGMGSSQYRTIVAADTYQITADKLNGYTFSDNSTGAGKGIGYVFHTPDGDQTATEYVGTKRVVEGNTEVKIYYRYSSFKLTYYPNFGGKTSEEFIVNYKSYINEGGENAAYGVGGVLRNYDGGNLNHSFVGFSKDNAAINGGTYIPLNYTMPSEAISVYANWQVNKVDLKVNNGSEVKTMVTDIAPTLVSGTEKTYSYGGTSYTDGDVESVTFTQPTDEQKQSIAQAGTNVVGFYFDAEHTQPVTWPLTVSYDSADALSVVASAEDGVNDNVTIYAWCEDLNNKIVFETNYGQLPEGISNPMTFTAGQSVAAPQPTKEGYTFAGWEDMNGQLISGWHYVDEDVDKFDGSKVMNSNVGFIAYARWTGDPRTIYFDVNTPKGVTSYAFNSANDVVYDGTACYYYIQGTTGEAITNFDEVPEPRMYGYTFSGWADDSGKIYTGKVWPTKDITLKAKWVKDANSAFIQIDAYEKLEGKLVQVGTETMNGTDEVQNVNPSDIVTVRFTSTTSFYTGSAMFAVMYDKDFFIPYVPKESAGYSNTVEFANVNPENDYIKGTAATIDYNYELNHAAQDYIWPSSLDSAKTDYSVVLISLEPDVSMDTAVKPTKMVDGTWLFEMRFKVNPSTTKTQGSIWMDNAWTRNEDNSKGVTFYGWSANNKPDSMWATTNDAVTPDLYYAGTTVKVEGTAKTTTTITAELQTDVGSSTPAFADGAGNSRTYEGPIGTEIYSFPFPTAPGYEIDEYWVKKGGTISSTKGLTQEQLDEYAASGEIWYAGYMANAAQNNQTYIPQWIAKEYNIKFMSDSTGTKCDKDNNLTVQFDSLFKPGKDITKNGYSLDHWVDEETGDTLWFDNEGNPSLTKGNATLDYTLLFGKTRESEVIVFRPVFTPNHYDIIVTKTGKTSENKTVKVKDIVQYAPEAELPTFGMQYRLVKTIPAQRQENTLYLTVDQLLTVLKKGDPTAKVLFYDATAKKDIYEINVDDPLFIGDDGQGLLISGTTVQTSASKNKFTLGDALKGYDVTITFAPDMDKSGEGATFATGVTVDADGNYVKVISAGTAIDPAEIPLPEKYGYVSDGYWYQYTTKVTTTKLSATTALYADSTYTTKFNARKIYINALKENGTDLFYSNADGYNFGSTVNLKDAAKYVQTDKQYYTMVGYRMAEWSEADSKYVYTADDTLLTSYKIETEGTVIDGKNTICLLPVYEPAEINYTVEFYYENLSGTFDKDAAKTESGTATFGTSKSIDPAADFAAKEITGFSYDSTNANNVLTISSISGDPNANIFKVYYKRKTNTVTFMANGSEYDKKTLKYGEAISAPSVDPESAEEGKIFVKWSPDIAETMGTEALVYTAVFANEANKITFRVKGDSHADYYDFDTKNIAAGDPATVTTKAFETGYESDGKWYTDPGCQTEYTFGTVIEAPVILYTIVTPKTYSITFYNNGEKYGDTLYFVFGTDTAKADDNSRPGTDKNSKTVTDPVPESGKKFDGWYDDDSYSEKHTFETMVAEDIELYGRTIDNTGSVIFYYGYEGAPNEGIFYQKSGVVGTEVNPGVPIRDGYTFDGWTKTVTEITVGTTEVTAKWIKGKYTVIYVAVDLSQPENSATVSITKNPETGTWNSYKTYTDVEFDSTLQVPDDPTVEYFEFTKWLDENSVEHTTMPALAAGSTLYLFPQFERITVTLLDDEGDGTEISKDKSNAKVDPEEIKEIDDGNGGTIKVGYIYDFAEGLDAEAIEDQMAIKGNGRLTITPYYQIGYEITTYTTCGTGSVIELIDNVTGKTVERYYIVIFGDINGDGRANSTDCSYIRNGKTTSEDEEMAKCIMKAGDINYNSETGAIERDGVINTDDMFIISKLTARKLIYDRTTGTMAI